MFDPIRNLISFAFIVIMIAVAVIIYFDGRRLEQAREAFPAVCATEARLIVYEHGTYAGLVTGTGDHSGGVSAAELIASGSVQTVETQYPTRGFNRYFAAPLGDERCLVGRDEISSRYPEFAGDSCVALVYSPTSVGDLGTVTWDELLPGHSDIRRSVFLLVERSTGRVIAEQIRLRQHVSQLLHPRTLSCPRGLVDQADLLVSVVLLGKSAGDVTVIPGAGPVLSEGEMRDYQLAYTVADTQDTFSVVDDSDLPPKVGGDANDLFDDDAAVHGIGVFGSVDNQDVVRVNVENADNIILVLSARYSVKWEIDARESDIDHVIVLGGDPQTVTGLDSDVPISNYSTSSSPEALPRVWAWDEGSASYGSLRSRVRAITGHTFESFQGERRAAFFDLRFAPNREGVVEMWVDEEGVINYSDRPQTN